MSGDTQAPPPFDDSSPQTEPSSRLCVKNLPKYVDEGRLKKHFGVKGEVTDVKIMKTKDGLSRQFGFVGFKTVDQAVKAMKHFDKSFFDTLKISVEYSHKVNDASLHRPWSKHSKGSSKYEKMNAPQADPSAPTDATKPDPTDAKKDAKKAKPSVADLIPAELKSDPKLREFLAVVQPRSSAKLWANDDLTGPNATIVGGQKVEKLVGKPTTPKEAMDGASDEEEEEYEDLTDRLKTAKGAEGEDDDMLDAEAQGDAPKVDEGPVDDLAYLKSKAAIKSSAFDDDDDAWLTKVGAKGGDDEDEDEDDDKEEGDEMGEDEDEPNEDAAAAAAPSHTMQGGEDEAASEGDEMDAIFNLDARKKEAKTTVAKNAAAAAAADSEDEEAAVATAALFGNRGGTASGPAADDGFIDVLETGRLFLRNLPFTATEEELRDTFSRFGQVTEAHVCLDKGTRKSKGFAYVAFDRCHDAKRALEEMDGNIFQGRLIHVMPARRPLQKEDGLEAEGGDKSALGRYKDQKEAKKKTEAGNKVVWNTLFMRQDTVLEAIAVHYGVPKSEMMDPDSSDLPVRMALGETWVVAETKRGLEEAGCNVAALEEAAKAAGSGASKAVERSTTALVVKNIPYSTTEQDLVQLFGKVGPLGRVILPETRTIAIVEYIEGQDARAAFKSLAYRRFQHVPLYLEWAPKNIFSTPTPREPLAYQAAPLVQPETPAQPTDLGEESNTLFVKGLAFSTADAALRKHVDRACKDLGIDAGAIRSARVAMKEGKQGGQLSKGFGFVETASVEIAARLLHKLQGSKLDGHKLQLSFSSQGADGAAAATTGAGKTPGGKSKSAKVQVPEGFSKTKLIVRNLAFEATRKELVQLFNPFGEIKSCRLPRKFDGNHRGFAFVEFSTPQEAQNALDALASTHLYGRHLVFERAKEGEDLEDLREKTADKMRKAEEFLESKKTKKRRTGDGGGGVADE